MNGSLIDLINNTLRQQIDVENRIFYGVSAATPRRRGTVTRLLEVATNIIATEGFAALTFRNLARQCDMGLSNLQYYFPTSNDLIESMLRYILANYMKELLSSSFLQNPIAQDRLRAFFEFLAADVKRRQTSALFIAVWDLAQRNEFVAAKLDELYSVEREVIRLMLAEISPDQNTGQHQITAGLISALFEGMMPLFGQATTTPPSLANIHIAAVCQACDMAGIPQQSGSTTPQ